MPRRTAALFVLVLTIAFFFAETSHAAPSPPAPFSLLRRSRPDLKLGTVPPCVGLDAVCGTNDGYYAVCNDPGLYCPPTAIVGHQYLNATCRKAPPSTTLASDLYMKPCSSSLDCVWASIPEGPIAALTCVNTTAAGDAKCVNPVGAAGDGCALDVECLSGKCDSVEKKCVGVPEGGACTPWFFDADDDDYDDDERVHYNDDGENFSWKSSVAVDTCDTGLYCKTSSPHSGSGTCKPMLRAGQVCAANEHNDEADDDAIFGGCGDGTVCLRTNSTAAEHICSPALSALPGSYGRGCACASGYYRRVKTPRDDDDFDVCVGDAPSQYSAGDKCNPAGEELWSPWFMCEEDLSGTYRLVAVPPCYGFIYPTQFVPVDLVLGVISCTAKAGCRTFEVMDPLAPPRIGSCQYQCLDEYRAVASSLLNSLEGDKYFTAPCGQWSSSVVSSALSHAWALQSLPGY